MCPSIKPGPKLGLMSDDKNEFESVLSNKYSINSYICIASVVCVVASIFILSVAFGIIFKQ